MDVGTLSNHIKFVYYVLLVFFSSILITIVETVFSKHDFTILQFTLKLCLQNSISYFNTKIVFSKHNFTFSHHNLVFKTQHLRGVSLAISVIDLKIFIFYSILKNIFSNCGII